MTPYVEEGLLNGVLSEMPVTQDAVGDLEEAGLVSDRERLEGALIALLSTSHEV